MLKVLINTPPRTQKQIIEDNRQIKARLGIKRFPKNYFAMTDEEFEEWAKNRNKPKKKNVSKI